MPQPGDGEAAGADPAPDRDPADPEVRRRLGDAVVRPLARAVRPSAGLRRRPAEHRRRVRHLIRHRVHGRLRAASPHHRPPSRAAVGCGRYPYVAEGNTPARRRWRAQRGAPDIAGDVLTGGAEPSRPEHPRRWHRRRASTSAPSTSQRSFALALGPAPAPAEGACHREDHPRHRRRRRRRWPPTGVAPATTAPPRTRAPGPALP